MASSHGSGSIQSQHAKLVTLAEMGQNRGFEVSEMEHHVGQIDMAALRQAGLVKLVAKDRYKIMKGKK